MKVKVKKTKRVVQIYQKNLFSKSGLCAIMCNEEVSGSLKPDASCTIRSTRGNVRRVRAFGACCLFPLARIKPLEPLQTEQFLTSGNGNFKKEKDK